MKIQREFDRLTLLIVLLFSVIPVLSILTHNNLVVASSFVLAILIMIFIRKTINARLIQPILDISRKSYLISSGRLDTEIIVETNDELAELARNINLLAGSLREKIRVLEESVQREQRVVRELAILNEFIGYVSSELNFEAILNKLIEKTRDLMRAQDGVVILFQPDRTKTFLSTDELLNEQLIKDMLSVDSGGLARIIAEQKPIRNNDISFRLSNGNEIRNFIALSLNSPTELQCLLIIMNKDGGFSQDDEDSFLNFAFQAFHTISLQNEIAKLATTDGLTGLNNHRMFQDRLSEEIQRAERYKSKLFLLLIDIDHFKRFNDTYGHQTGDDVLRTMAQIIKGSIRKVDFAARYGGEEFVLILPETDCGHTFTVAERIRKAVMDYPFNLKDGTKAGLTVSIGVACFPEDSAEKEDLIRKADTALYFAKGLGRNKVCLYRDICEPEE
ncbi:MAG TPA: diguanylate cyclase [Nitrospirae bacterium]|nr:diguanylate cyclase [Nitrospirota bacterium]